MSDATGKFVKSLNIPVVMAKINGAYFTAPKWGHTKRIGKVEVIYEQLLSKEDIDNLSASEVMKVLNEKLSYDDYEWNDTHQVSLRRRSF